MTLGLDIDVDDTRPDGLDALRDTLAQTHTVPEVIEIRERLFNSVFHRIRVLKPGTDRHIGPGPIPTFFRRAIALCEARRHELTAHPRQASGGATAGFWEWE